MIEQTSQIVAGAVGGLLKSLLEQNGKIALPGYEVASDGTKYVHFGFGVNLLLGGAAGMFTLDPVGAFAAGMSSAFIGEKVVERVKVKPNGS
jgi:hypothetical protein